MPPELENEDLNVPSPDEEINIQLSDEDVETVVNIDEEGNATLVPLLKMTAKSTKNIVKRSKNA